MSAMARRRVMPGDALQEDFARHASELPGARLEWLNARRRAAMQAIAQTGLPDRRVEAWKWTDLANTLSGELLPSAGTGPAIVPQSVFPPQDWQLVFADGRLKSAPFGDGIECVDLSKLDDTCPGWVREHLGGLAAGPDQPMGAASLALMRGGAAIRVTRSASLHVQFAAVPANHPAVSHCRLLLQVEGGAALRLIESHHGAVGNGSLRNLGIELRLMPGARLEHVRLQRDCGDALHVTSLGAEIGRGAFYRGVYAALGGQLSRLDVRLTLAAEGAEAAIHNVAAIAAGLADITTVTDHASPHTRSRQLFKNVAGGTGRVVNQGRVIVRQGAQKSDSHQLFKSLLLSRHAEADAKPELEIFADDVQCGHGTAIGALDEDALFYLRSRGISAGEAKLLLIRAFIADALEEIGDDAVREALRRELDVALQQAEGAP